MDPLARLFGSFARLKLLRLFLFNDDMSFTVPDTAFRTKTPIDSVRKELRVLIASGCVKKSDGKGGVQYRANKRFEHYEALLAFMRSTTSISDSDITSTLKKAGSLRLVTLSGIFTGVIETKIDLLVVGDKLHEPTLDACVHALEAELGRELRYAAFSTEQFKYRRGVYDRLLRDVFDYSHRNILDKLGL